MLYIEREREIFDQPYQTSDPQGRHKKAPPPSGFAGLASSLLVLTMTLTLQDNRWADPSKNEASLGIASAVSSFPA